MRKENNKRELIIVDRTSLFRVNFDDIKYIDTEIIHEERIKDFYKISFYKTEDSINMFFKCKIFYNNKLVADCNNRSDFVNFLKNIHKIL